MWTAESHSTLPKGQECRGAVLATCMPQNTPQDLLSLLPVPFPSCGPGVPLHSCEQCESPESFRPVWHSQAHIHPVPQAHLGVTTSSTSTINIPAPRETQELCKPWTSETAALRQHTDAGTSVLGVFFYRFFLFLPFLCHDIRFVLNILNILIFKKY